jgi:hypothetical protein
MSVDLSIVETAFSPGLKPSSRAIVYGPTHVGPPRTQSPGLHGFSPVACLENNGVITQSLKPSSFRLIAI